MVHAEKLVTKSDGTQEPFSEDKIHKLLFWGTEGISNVSVSQIEIKARMQIESGIATRKIHDILIQAAHDLISEETPNYQYVAARLKLFQLRKDVYGQFDPCSLYELVEKNTERGVYTHELLNWYTKEEFDQMDSFVNHERDFNYAYAGITQVINKYLVQNRVTNEKYESPQMTNIVIAATIFHNVDKSKRMKYIRELYNELSNFNISLPSPIMAGVRTRTKQFSSCVLIECGDSLESINRSASAIVNYASKKAGIGINAGAIRAVGSEIRKGDAKHTGVTPFYRYFQSALKSCSQGGIRGASAALYAPWFHYEIETIMVLKNNKGTDDDRVRKLDYSIMRNELLFKRYLAGERLTLFSPNEVPDLMAAFEAGDNELFEELYVKYEKKRGLKKKRISAEKWFDIFHTERKETGRLYYANMDHMNSHGAFDPNVKPIKQSNLCLEIALPTEVLGEYKTNTVTVEASELAELTKKITEEGGQIKLVDYNEQGDFEVVYDEVTGRIQLCTLAAYNLGNYKTKEEMGRSLEILVRALNELLDYQDYPEIEAYLATMEHRPLGIGLSNAAYFFAKNDVHYGDDACLELWDETIEAFQYHLIRASMEVAKERGETCTRFSDTKYSKGIFPIDTYKKAIDEDLVNRPLSMDWKWLKEQVAEHGMMNATLSAQMPVESSALVINALNGIEMPKALVTEKENSGAIVKQVVPQIHKLKNKYDLLWDQPSCLGYLKVVAVLQKHIDQAISGNTFFNPENYPSKDPELDGMIPMEHLIELDLLSYRWGIKTGYYCHVYDGAGDETQEACAGGSCSV
jgi:ribonucleoside-diphosphate reductase alpha chain